MALSQPATFDETWSDERVASYLSRQPVAGENADFHALMTAYKHMRAADFHRLLIMFKAAGRDINARNPQGRSLLEIVREHPQSEAFVKLLSDAS